MKLKSLFFLIFLFLFIGLETIYACLCGFQQTCRSYADAEVVFVGKAMDFTIANKTVKRTIQRLGSKEWVEREYVEKRQVSRLKIEEGFTGTNGKKEVFIETEISSSCGLFLQRNVTYLIYAKKVKGEKNLMTYFCAGTKSISDATKDLKYLRTNKNKTAKVFGKVEFGEYGNINFPLLKKYGVNTVTLESKKRKFQTVINQDGSYNFADIPKGKYKISINLPKTLTIAKNYYLDIAEELGIGDQSVIEVSKHGCSEKEFLIKENGRISGRITDAVGNPIEDITVYLIPLSKTGKKIEPEELCYDTGLCLKTNKNGEYAIKALKAGKYFVGVRLGKYVSNDSTEAAYFATYYPSVADEKKAIPVEVKTGQPTKNINFTLTKKYQKREITGRVFFKDGRPAAKVSVRYSTRTPDFKDTTLIFIKTDENGYFSFTGYETYSYLIGAFTDSRDRNENLQAIAVVINVLPKKKIEKIKLILDQDDKKKCEKCGNYFEFPNPSKRKTKKKTQKLINFLVND